MSVQKSLQGLKIGNVTRSAIKRCLHGFRAEQDPPLAGDWPRGFEDHSVSHDEVPVPELFYLCLVEVLSCRHFGPAEKLRWLVPFNYFGSQCCFALQKFGLQLYIPAERNAKSEHVTPKEIVDKLNRACRIVEKRILAPYVKQQLSQSHLTVMNHYLQLTMMYRHFRDVTSWHFDKAKETSTNDKGPQHCIEDRFPAAVDAWNQQADWTRIGFYNAVATIDAYFSRLEHLLVLALPCLRWTRSRDSLPEFIRLRWGEKFKRIFDVLSDRRAKQLYDQLRVTKERYRNTYAHGGFEKGGASFFVHVPGVGALPAPLSNIRESRVFDLFPITPSRFSAICELFDDVDAWLKLGLGWVVTYAESGLNLACDDDSLDRLRQASESNVALEQLIDRWGWEADRHVNMDY